MYTEDYLDWVKDQDDLPPLTRTQYLFAEWLLKEENAKVLAQIGNLEDVFHSVRKFVKSSEYHAKNKKNGNTQKCRTSQRHTDLQGTVDKQDQS